MEVTSCRNEGPLAGPLIPFVSLTSLQAFYLSFDPSGGRGCGNIYTLCGLQVMCTRTSGILVFDKNLEQGFLCVIVQKSRLAPLENAALKFCS